MKPGQNDVYEHYILVNLPNEELKDKYNCSLACSDIFFPVIQMLKIGQKQIASISQDAYERPAVWKFEEGQKMREVKTP